MDMLTRILQISDLHIGEGEEVDKNFDLIVERIIDKGENGNDWKENKPLILITGDIVNDGEEVQFIHARNYLYRLSNAGFKLRLIPGNHDYGKNGNDANEESFDLYKKYFGNFHEMEYPLCEPLNEPSSPNGHFLVGLNSMEIFTASNFAEGRLGDSQINKVCEFLETHKNRPQNQKMIVYLHHHPFIFPDDGLFRRIGEHVGHRLEDGKDFMERIKDLKVDMLLFGHEHRHLDFKDTKLAKDYNIRHIISSGKSTEACYEYPVNYNGASKISSHAKSDKNYDDVDFPFEFNDEELLEEENKELSNLSYGLFGRLIEIDDNGQITVRTEIFEE